VDKVLKLSNNETVINNMIKSMEADSMTAFYDALMVGIQQVKEEEGLNVLVALTDGNDNMSKNTYKEVISYAKESNVPIYLIGLGNVNTDSLKLLADNTDGQFFYANSATVLNEIYDKISTKLQAFYDMTYISPNLEVDSNERTLEITFIKEEIHLITEKERFDIDENVLTYMFEKEAEKKRLYLIYGGLGLEVLVAGGIFFHFYSKRKNVELKIAKVYPNPTTGIVTLIIENNKSKEGLLTVFNQSGNQVQQEKISSNSEVNLEHLPSNLYFLSVSFDGNNSKPVKLLKK
jgi:Ca-activated chloride channel family protein